MEVPIPVPGFEAPRVALRGGGWKSAQILLDGQSVPRAKGVFHLTAANGATAELRPSAQYLISFAITATAAALFVIAATVVALFTR